MHAALLLVHVAAGSAGLVLGPFAFRAAAAGAGRPRRSAAAYQVAVAALCASALGLVALRPALWFLGPVALGTQAAALAGWAVSRGRLAGGAPRQVRLVGGSYVSLVTALLVVSWAGFPLAWVLPTAIGHPLIERAARRAGAAAAAGALAGAGAWRP